MSIYVNKKWWLHVWNLHNPMHDVVGSQTDIPIFSNDDILKLSDGPFKWMVLERREERLLWIYVLPRSGPIGKRVSRRKGYHKLLYDWLKYGIESKVEETDMIRDFKEEEENESIEKLIANFKEELIKVKEIERKWKNDESRIFIIKSFLEQVMNN